MLKRVISFFEILIGFLLLSIAAYSLINIYRCPEESWDCGGWALLGVYMILPISIFLLLAGYLLLKYKSWYSQILVLPAISWCVYWFII